HGGRLYSQVSTGIQFDIKDIAGGATKPITIEKIFVRGDFMTPSKLQTKIDGKIVAETKVDWDSRVQGPASTTSTAGANPLGNAAPVAGMGGKVDGKGSPVGAWDVTALGQKLSVNVELDPLGNLLSSTINGAGAKITYSSGGAGVFKTSTSLI